MQNISVRQSITPAMHKSHASVLGRDAPVCRVRKTKSLGVRESEITGGQEFGNFSVGVWDDLLSRPSKNRHRRHIFARRCYPPAPRTTSLLLCGECPYRGGQFAVTKNTAFSKKMLFAMANNTAAMYSILF